MNKEVKEWGSAELAHPGKRYQGQFIDGLISIAIFALCIYVTRTLGIDSDNANSAIIGLPFAYFVFSDAFPNGQSLGKIPLGICVVSKKTGKPCSLLQSFARNFLTPILGTLDAVLIFGKKRQRLGDRIANTVVIHRPTNKFRQRDA